MKKVFSIFASLLIASSALVSCSSDDNGGGGNNNDQFVELTGNLESRTLTNDKKYLLKGQVFVRDGRTLTIQPGTVIFGDKATKGTLIIDRGGKIIADGTASQPIVFTSALAAGTRDRGDWGGLVILGRARTNQTNPEIEGITPAAVFGGDNDADDSGILRYVRVEFAGIELTPNNETNSITMGGVGNGTVMEYCMVTYGGDDGFEWFGGSNNGKYLISLGMWDDDFDVDFGYSGKNQFGLAVRYTSFADQSGSNGFECDNGPNDNETSLLTTGTFSNFTVIGPRWTNTQNINGNYQHAIDLRRRVAVTIGNSVFCGFPRGIRMNQQSVVGNYVAGTGVLVNNILVAPTQTFSFGTGVTGDWDVLWNNNNNQTITDTDLPTVYAGLGLRQEMFYATMTNDQFPSNPNFAVTTGTLTSGASFTNPKLSNSFFQQVAYRGAFGATDWTDGWADFNPIFKAY